MSAKLDQKKRMKVLLVFAVSLLTAGALASHLLSYWFYVENENASFVIESNRISGFKKSGKQACEKAIEELYVKLGASPRSFNNRLVDQSIRLPFNHKIRVQRVTINHDAGPQYVFKIFVNESNAKLVDDWQAEVQQKIDQLGLNYD